jgi:hypothetical protein
MSESAIPAPLGDILASLSPQMAKALQIDPAELQKAAHEAITGKILQGDEVYVLYADVLGFRALLQTDAAQLEKRLENALILTNFAILARVPGGVPIHSDGRKEQMPIVGLTQLNPASIFSDSLFVVSYDDSDESLRQIAHAANTAFVHFFGEALPLRGAIAKGKVWWNRNTDVRLGNGITRAYDLAEGLDCVGIAIGAELPHPANSVGPVPFPAKEIAGVLTKDLRVPLQLGRNSLPMAFRRDLVDAFRAFSRRPENTASPELRARYSNSLPIIEAMARDPVSA